MSVDRAVVLSSVLLFCSSQSCKICQSGASAHLYSYRVVTLPVDDVSALYLSISWATRQNESRVLVRNAGAGMASLCHMASHSRGDRIAVCLRLYRLYLVQSYSSRVNRWCTRQPFAMNPEMYIHL